MSRELGIPPSAVSVANHYGNLLTGFVLDRQDAELAKELKIPTLVTNTLMKNAADRQRLAEDVLHLVRV
jgi:LPPG:FO 2-phospho-L-lactate transferase